MENTKLSSTETLLSKNGNQQDSGKLASENLVKSINVLIQSAVKGQKSGVYTLDEAAIIVDAIKFLQNTLGGSEQQKSYVYIKLDRD